MVTSSLNTKLLEDRLGYIAKSVGKLKVMASLPEERFLNYIKSFRTTSEI